MRDAAGNTVLRWLDDQGRVSPAGSLLRGVGNVTRIGAVTMETGADLLYWTAPAPPACRWHCARPTARCGHDSAAGGWRGRRQRHFRHRRSGARRIGLLLHRLARGRQRDRAGDRPHKRGHAHRPAGLARLKSLAVDQPCRWSRSRRGRDFVLIGAAGASSITVAELTVAGRLVVTDQVGDDLYAASRVSASCRP